MIETMNVKQLVHLQDYWVMRAIQDNGDRKTVVDEHTMEEEPTKQAIAEFLYMNDKATFVSVEHNYRFINEFPF